MKQETNNEMDLLLRRLGRRDEPGAADDHLDADELNAYAENALPAKARARYTAHLAECSQCRTLVVQLSSSANVVASTNSAAVREPSGFRKLLASLFTPMVLRYAAPALGLIVVAAIGFVVLRRDRAGSYVAQETNTQEHIVITPAAKSPEVNQDNGLVFSTNTPSPGQTTDRVEKSKQEQAVAPVPNAPPTVTNVETEVAKDKAVAQPQREEQKVAADSPPPAKPEPTATPAASARAAEPQVAKNEDKVQTGAPTTETAGKEVRGARDDRTGNFARARRPEATLGSVASAQGRGDTDLSTNIRVVAGRRFQRKGGVWIDTAYDSSKDVMTLTRGSEQYRALVADEPEIKTIADQLEGEILVVWKTRTYRIH